MFEDVGKDRFEFGAKALVDVNVLLDLKIYVPEGHAANHPSPTSATVQTKNGIADAVKYGLRVAEHIDIASSADTPGTRHAVVTRTSEIVGTSENGVFIGTEVNGVGLTERLTVKVAGIEFERQATACSEDRRE